MPHRVGYCCINLTLGKNKITTGRTMRLASFREDTKLERTSSLTLQNAQDLVKILKWNIENDVRVFRIGSNIFPWFEEYNETDLPDYQHILLTLREAGEIIMSSGMRVSFHPDHFVKLASSKPDVVKRSINNLHHHNRLYAMMDIPVNHYYPLNIHVGMNRSQDIIDKFCEQFQNLNITTQQRLVVENDDKANAFSVRQLHEDIYSRIKTPITFDYFHHEFHPDGLTTQQAAELAASTWVTTPLFHYSESKNLNESVSGNPRAHSDYAFKKIDDFGLDIDIDLEIKAKELGYFKYLEYIV